MASSAIPSSYTPFIKQKNLGLHAFSAQFSFFSLQTPKKNVSKKIASVMSPQPSERNPSTTGSVAADVKLTVNWIMDDIAAYLKNEKLSMSDIKFTPKELGELLASIKSGTISEEIGKEILFELMAKGGTVKGLIKEKDLVQIVDPMEIEKMVDKVIAANLKQLEQYRGAETMLQGYFADQIMKESKGKANPGLLNKILLEKLNAKS